MDTIKKLLAQGLFEQALQALKQLTSTTQDDAELKEATYYQAVALRYLKRFDEAQQHLQALLQRWPDFGRAHQELGHCYRDQQQLSQALPAYYQALRLNPALHASWKSAGLIEQQQGNTSQAERNLQQVAFLAKQPKEILAAQNLYYEGKYYKAERICRAFLQRQPHHVEAMRTLANIGMQLDVLNDAEFLLESVLVLEPDNDLARYDYIKVLQRRQKHQQAIEHAQVLFDKEPHNPIYKALYANLSATLDNNDKALQLYNELLTDEHADKAGIYVAKGHLLKAIGEQQQAISAYQNAYQIKPDFGDAYWSLANLKIYQFSDEELTQMEQQVTKLGTTVVDQIHLNFALGRAYEQRKEAANSFGYYDKGNQLKRDNSQFKSEVLHNRIKAQQEYFSADKVAELSTKTMEVKGAESPIFIVGLPRAGSTLIEQILAAHSQVEGTMELPNIPAIAHGLNGRQVHAETPRYPFVLDELAASDLAKLGQRYLDETQVYRQGKPFFTDKMPNNFRHIGLIKTILPNAKIIDARRHPLDCCFSAFKQLFAEGQEFSYGQEMLGQYYNDYVDLMAHWKRVYPDAIHTMIHEQLVADPEAQIKQLLDYLGLPFEAQCLNFHQQKRSVKTASSEQVRQPINRQGMNQWQPYEAFLTPLMNVLGSTLTDWDQR